MKRPGQHQAQGPVVENEPIAIVVAHQAPKCHMINFKLKALLAPSTLEGLNQDIWVPSRFKNSQRL